MTRSRIRVWALITAPLMTVILVTAAQPDPWSELKHRTAWMLVGEWNVNSREWATQLRTKIVRRGVRGDSALPNIGDVMEILSEPQLVILNYRVSGERDRNLVPGNRALTKMDLTDVQLRPGALVKVEDTFLETAFRGKQGVWVRIVPAPDPRYKH